VLKNWLEACRPFSLTAALVPVLVGSALAFGFGTRIDPINFAIVLVGGVLLQVGTNMTNDVYDFWNGVDTIETPRASRVAIEGRLDPRTELRGAYVVFAIAVALALLLAVRVTPLILLPVGLGVMGGFWYTAPPLQYKYRGLGIPVVFVMMGPLMVWAAYLGVGGRGWWLPVLISLPVGFLVSAILHANDLRDVQDDKQAHILTLTGLMGYDPARWLYWFLMLAPYAVVAAVAAAGMVSRWVLLALLTLPLAVQTVRVARVWGRERLAVLDQMTAKIHLLFGLLLALGLGAGRL
jgi:1,4-dihydroxy-2-naphthoate octaprenyltransferase